ELEHAVLVPPQDVLRAVAVEVTDTVDPAARRARTPEGFAGHGSVLDPQDARRSIAALAVRVRKDVPVAQEDVGVAVAVEVPGGHHVLVRPEEALDLARDHPTLEVRDAQL